MSFSSMLKDLGISELALGFDAELFHFLRPQWLWGLLVLLPLALWVLRARHSAGAWKQWVDPALQAHVLTQGVAQRQWYKQLWLVVVWTLACLALAGPTWQQLPSPLLRSEQARIVVLDLSRSMLASDMEPSRLELARLKVHDILQQSRDSKAGLVAFAAQAFSIAPLTDDIQTLLSQVPALHPDLMPAQCGRVDRALLQAKAMLEQGGAGGGGQVVLVTDSKPQEAAFEAAQSLHDAGYELSVLAVGTRQGAPIPESSRRGRGFVKDPSGSIVIAKLPVSDLRQLALSGGGQFSLLTADDRDISKLNKILDHDNDMADDGAQAKAGDQWAEAGPLLLLLLMPLVLLGFRRGWLMMFVLIAVLPAPQPVYAEGVSPSAVIEAERPGLWFNPDQRGHQALQAGDAMRAQQLFESKDWKAAADYRAGQAPVAAEYWAQQEGAAAAYNWGNALAQTGDLPAAINAWKTVPENNALHASAVHNAEVMQALLDEQEQGAGDSQSGDENSKENEDGEQSQENAESNNEPQEGESGQNQSQDASDPSGQASEGEQQESPEPGEQESQASKPENASENELSESETRQSAEAESAEEGDKQTEQAPAMTAEERAQEQAQEQIIEQWLNRVPDDPGGLLREKFKRDYQRRNQQRGRESLDKYQDEDEAW